MVSQLQVLPSLNHLPRCQKHHFSAFIRDRQMLIVWDDQPKNLLQRATYIEESLIEMISGDGEVLYEIVEEKKTPNISTVELADGTVTPSELEDAPIRGTRPTLLLNPIMVGGTLTLLNAALGMGWGALAQKSLSTETTHDWHCLWSRHAKSSCPSSSCRSSSSTRSRSSVPSLNRILTPNLFWKGATSTQPISTDLLM
jgi:hypothetical protein